MKLTVAAACIADHKGARTANLEAAVAQIHQLAAAGAQLVVLPEACLQGYAIEGSDLSLAQLRTIAEPFDGEYARAFRLAARQAGVYLVACYDRRDGDRIYNTAELIDPRGTTIGTYDKTHTVGRSESRYYSAGTALPVFDTEFGKIGILVCIDRTYAENWRVLMLQGARLVLIPANGGCGEKNTYRLQAMAFDQCLCCVFAHPRRALIIDVQGNLVDHDEEAARPYAIGALDLQAVEARQTDLHSRRRPELYGPVAHSQSQNANPAAD